MSVESYSIEVGAVQRDGTRSIVERYFDGQGVEVEMLCSKVSPKQDLDTLALARMAEINARPVPRQSDATEVKLEEALFAYRRGDLDAAKLAISEAKTAVDQKEAGEVTVRG